MGTRMQEAEVALATATRPSAGAVVLAVPMGSHPVQRDPGGNRGIRILPLSSDTSDASAWQPTSRRGLSP